MAKLNLTNIALSASIIYLENQRNQKIKQMAKIKLPAKKPIGVQHIELVLRSMGVKFVNEFQFIQERKFRFDIAIPERKIAIEYEGLTTKNNKKSGHTTNVGYSQDCEKYNYAVCNGWKLLRFTAYNYEDATKFLNILMPDK